MSMMQMPCLKKNALYFLVKVLKIRNVMWHPLVAIKRGMPIKLLDPLYQPKKLSSPNGFTMSACGISLRWTDSRDKLYYSNRICQSIGGWKNGALTEDTDISFKIMQSGKLIALAYNSEAFQQEPETLKSYYMQRKRWAKGNYGGSFQFKHLFGKEIGA